MIEMLANVFVIEADSRTRPDEGTIADDTAPIFVKHHFDFVLSHF